MPNHIRSMPAASTMGSMMEVVSTTTEMPSRKQPRMMKNTVRAASSIQGESSMVPIQAAKARIVFLRKQADVVAQRQKTLEQRACLRDAPLQGVVVGEPEAAGQEGAFSRRQAVHAVLRAVAQDEAVHQELALDRGHRAEDARIVGRQEAHDRYKQEARIELLASEALREGVAAAVEALFADRGVHALAQRAPALDGCFEPEALGVAQRPVEGDPGHHLGIGEMAPASAHLPDALVRLFPYLFQVLDQTLL